MSGFWKVIVITSTGERRAIDTLLAEEGTYRDAIEEALELLSGGSEEEELSFVVVTAVKQTDRGSHEEEHVRH